MSALFSGEALVLLLVSLFLFKLGPNIAHKLLVGEHKSTDAQQLDTVLKLVLVLLISSIVVSFKWFLTHTVVWSLFPVLFTTGIVLAVARFLMAIGIWASYKKFTADPLALLLQVCIGAFLVILSGESQLFYAMLVSNNAFFVLIVLFMFMFRPMFAFHELMDAKYFRSTQSGIELVRSCVERTIKISGSSRFSLEALSHVVMAGTSPFILFAILTGFDLLAPFFLPIVGLVLAFIGIGLAKPLAQYWALIESVRTKSDTFSITLVVENFSILIVPYVMIAIVAIVRGVFCAFLLTSPTEAVEASSKYISNYLPERETVNWYTETALNSVLLVHSIQVMVTIAYKRFVSHIRLFQ
jgi:hypothetical protein